LTFSGGGIQSGLPGKAFAHSEITVLSMREFSLPMSANLEEMTVILAKKIFPDLVMQRQESV
jgi:hypothetical protein